MSSTNGTVVRLNVGGAKYEVAKSTIEKYPDTMLARLISDTWQDKDGKKRAREEDEKQEEFFVDADGLQFRFVLEYMRHQKVDLPMNISKDAILKDLKYFGFHEVPAEAISRSGANLEAATHMKMFEEQYKAKQEELNTELEFSKMAYEFFKGHIENEGEMQFVISLDVFARHRHLFIGGRSAEKTLAIFNKCFGEYGFCYDRFEKRGGGRVHVKKLV